MNARCKECGEMVTTHQRHRCSAHSGQETIVSPGDPMFEVLGAEMLGLRHSDPPHHDSSPGFGSDSGSGGDSGGGYGGGGGD